MQASILIPGWRYTTAVRGTTNTLHQALNQWSHREEMGCGKVRSSMSQKLSLDLSKVLTEGEPRGCSVSWSSCLQVLSLWAREHQQQVRDLQDQELGNYPYG